ncbi:hypothetical protein H311_02175 [Anncaliia algerae PRA109]|nr:hypothetical protein H311_02175 [Anncaliia algerae PRA109]
MHILYFFNIIVKSQGTIKNININDIDIFIDAFGTTFSERKIQVIKNELSSLLNEMIEICKSKEVFEHCEIFLNNIESFINGKNNFFDKLTFKMSFLYLNKYLNTNIKEKGHNTALYEKIQAVYYHYIKKLQEIINKYKE